jgi:flagellar biosynthesis protein FlhF
MTPLEKQMNATVRTFRARDSRSALALVKAALGPEAMILSMREVGGLLREPQVEMTAALSVPDAPAAAATAAPALSIVARDAELLEQLRVLRHALEDARQRFAGEKNGEDRPRAGAQQQRLIELGAEPSVAKSIGANVKAAAQLAQAIAQRIETVRPPWMPGRRKVIALVGPPGVGKTTTIAKMAARAALTESKPGVALITVDTWRIGAREHLARYAEILGIELTAATSGAELATQVKAASSAGLVLIDTAGRSDAEAVARQAQLLRAVPGIELHLALSASMGWQQLAEAAHAWRDLGPDRVILTRLDEAVTPVSTLSALLRLRLPVSCFTDGQRVPEDLQPADPLRLANLMIESHARHQENSLELV